MGHFASLDGEACEEDAEFLAWGGRRTGHKTDKTIECAEIDAPSAVAKTGVEVELLGRQSVGTAVAADGCSVVTVKSVGGRNPKASVAVFREFVDADARAGQFGQRLAAAVVGCDCEKAVARRAYPDSSLRILEHGGCRLDGRAEAPERSADCVGTEDAAHEVGHPEASLRVFIDVVDESLGFLAEGSERACLTVEGEQA